MTTSKKIISESLCTLMAALAVLCTGCGAMGPEKLMTQATKTLYADISDEYQWMTMPEIVNDEIGAMSAHIEVLGPNAFRQVSYLDRDVSNYWYKEKENLYNVYTERISKLNWLQKKFFYKKMKNDWEDYTERYKYHHVLLTYYLDEMDCLSALKEQEEIASNLAQEESALLIDVGRLREKKASLQQEKSNLEDEYSRLSNQKSQLQADNRRLLDQQEKLRIRSNPATMESYKKQLDELAWEITELECKKVPMYLQQFRATYSPKTMGGIYENKRAASSLAEALDRLIKLSDKAYKLSREIGSNLADGYLNTYNRACATRAELRNKIGY